MQTAKLYETARQLLQKPKGILAADESAHTCQQRFETLNIPCTETTRRDYRQMLFTTPEINQFISGVILFDETIRQYSRSGQSLVKVLENQNIIPGIKVDLGLIDLTNFPEEKVTQGLDNLQGRVEEYAKLGARFAKWRALFTISDSLPTPTCILSNTEVLARYAAICQNAGIVPIVEPEVLYDGHHSLIHSEKIITEVLKALFRDLAMHRVDLQGLILKSSMVLPGKQSSFQTIPEEIAHATIRAFKASVPSDVAGIVFLSGGQTSIQATENLQAIAKLKPLPWPITFSFSRALQEPALEAWRGEESNLKIAQALFLHRAKLNSLASIAEYNPNLEATIPSIS